MNGTTIFKANEAANALQQVNAGNGRNDFSGPLIWAWIDMDEWHPNDDAIFLFFFSAHLLVRKDAHVFRRVAVGRVDAIYEHDAVQELHVRIQGMFQGQRAGELGWNNKRRGIKSRTQHKDNIKMKHMIDSLHFFPHENQR